MIFDTVSSRFVRSLIRYRLFFSCPVFQLEILKILIKKGFFVVRGSVCTQSDSYGNLFLSTFQVRLAGFESEAAT